MTEELCLLKINYGDIFFLLENGKSYIPGESRLRDIRAISLSYGNRKPLRARDKDARGSGTTIPDVPRCRRDNE